MREAGYFMDGSALHYYTRVKDHSIVIEAEGWQRVLHFRNPEAVRGTRSILKRANGIAIMKSAYFTDRTSGKHSAIMDKYDPEKQVALSSTNGVPGLT